ncbi:MAG: GNAT family N-acetyltransferase [Acidobacteriia bacterium]|nr:GNAT family N-acetyltransferase [Terriglobia bacterium]
MVAHTRDQLTIPVADGIELRRVSTADCDELYAAIDRNRACLRTWLPWVIDTFSLSDLTEFIRQREIDNADRVSLTTNIRHQGKLCGAIGLHAINQRDRNTSIGYWLDEAYQGQGIMTRACRAIVTEGFRQYGLHRIEIRCATGNIRSSAIPRRLGFVEEGILREAEWLYDHWVDLRVFSMLEQDWT